MLTCTRARCLARAAQHQIIIAGCERRGWQLIDIIEMLATRAPSICHNGSERKVMVDEYRRYVGVSR